MPSSENRLLAFLSPGEFNLLEPHHKSLTLDLRKHLETSNRRIDAVYFTAGFRGPSAGEWLWELMTKTYACASNKGVLR
jgi:hypothetical protein